MCRLFSDGAGHPSRPGDPETDPVRFLFFFYTDRTGNSKGSVFFIPDKSRITYIDLPACRDKLVLSAMIAGPVSSIIGSAALFAAGSTPSIPHQIAAGILLLALAALAKNLIKKNPGKGDSAA